MAYILPSYRERPAVSTIPMTLRQVQEGGRYLAASTMDGRVYHVSVQETPYLQLLGALIRTVNVS